MIFIQWKCLLISFFLVEAYFFFSAFYTYKVNAKLAPDDPEKKDYHPLTPWLAPIIVPLLFLVNIPVFILYGIVFGIFLMLFTLSLLLFRKPFLFKWIRKHALKVGRRILRINTEVLKLFGFSPIPNLVQ